MNSYERGKQDAFKEVFDLISLELKHLSKQFGKEKSGENRIDVLTQLSDMHFGVCLFADALSGKIYDDEQKALEASFDEEGD